MGLPSNGARADDRGGGEGKKIISLFSPLSPRGEREKFVILGGPMAS